VALTAGLITAGLAGSARAQPDEAAAQQAAREIAAAQDRANQAAAEWSSAGEQLEALEEHARALDQERVALEAQVTEARSNAERAAAEQFMSSGSAGIPLLTGYQEPLD
jgi:chromosome segregation ATPase